MKTKFVTTILIMGVDNSLTGLFYVNDPSNQAFASATPEKENNKFAYNDLQRRKQDMCKLLNQWCNGGLSVNTSPNVPFALVKAIGFYPSPVGSH